MAGSVGVLHAQDNAAAKDKTAEAKAKAPKDKKKAGKAIVYDSHAYPYFFTDVNANGKADPDEAIRTNSYKTWTPRLAKAAYNYQFVAKDPGGYAHNGRYVIQLLYDSIEDLGGNTSKMQRP